MEGQSSLRKQAKFSQRILWSLVPNEHPAQHVMVFKCELSAETVMDNCLFVALAIATCYFESLTMSDVDLLLEPQVQMYFH